MLSLSLVVWVLTCLSYSGFLSADYHMVAGLHKISKASSHVWSFIPAISEDLSWACWLEPYTWPLVVIRVSSESGGWVPRMNIPREP